MNSTTSKSYIIHPYDTISHCHIQVLHHTIIPRPSDLSKCALSFSIGHSRVKSTTVSNLYRSILSLNSWVDIFQSQCPVLHALHQVDHTIISATTQRSLNVSVVQHEDDNNSNTYSLVVALPS